MTATSEFAKDSISVPTRMKMVMDFENFRRSIVETGNYRTSRVILNGKISRLFRGMTWWFYCQVVWTVFRARTVTFLRGFSRHEWMFYAFVMMRAIERTGGVVMMEGMNILRAGPWPVVVVANHMSILETLILPCPLLFFGDVSVVVKDSLLRYPLFGKVLRQIAPISVCRTDPRKDLKTVLYEGEKRLQAGRTVIIFPQATRLSYFDPQEFNTLGVKLARKACVPIVPVALETDFQKIGRLLRDMGPVDWTRPTRFRMGKPMAVTGNGRDAHQYTLDFIGKAFSDWGLEIRRSGHDSEMS